VTISSRPYESENDLRVIQQATAEWINTAGFLGRVNPSDIALRLFNGMRIYDPHEIVRLWQDSDGRLVGWAMVYPAWNSFEVQLAPEHRQDALANEVLDWAEGALINWMQNVGRSDSPIELDVFEGDSVRITLLEHRGYACGELRGIISVRSLDGVTPPYLPDGFTIRSLTGEQDADKLVALVNTAFGWNWTVEAYQEVLRSPGYRAENEMVVIAPDGRFAASCILLPDEHNGTVMFENVCTSPDFRRLGLAASLLTAGMHRMKEQGFTLAVVPHGAHLDGAGALYASVGFQSTYMIYRYTKRVRASG